MMVVFFILCLCLSVSRSEQLSFENPQFLQGWYDHGLVLKQEDGRISLSSEKKEASWRTTLFSKIPLENFSLKIRFKGKIRISVHAYFQDSLVYNLDSESEKSLIVNIGDFQKSRVFFFELSPDDGQIISVDFPSELGNLNRVFSVKKKELQESADLCSKEWMEADFYSRDKKMEDLQDFFRIGINLEAVYLFDELSFLECKKLVDQIHEDGFSSVRLHKLFSVYQKWCEKGRKADFFERLEKILNLFSKKNLQIWLDILVWPDSQKYGQGWKQWIYLVEELQLEVKRWIFELSSLQIDNRPLFQSNRITNITLFNENSLFVSESSQAFLLQLQLYLRFITQKNEELQKKNISSFCSFDEWRVSRMRSVYKEYSTILRELGYLGGLFLTNHQVGGLDAWLNRQLSQEIDRHLYLDWPSFHAGKTRVRNLSPLDTRKRWQELLSEFSDVKADVFLSEFNLPWPNRFQHEMIPLLLWLKKYAKISGVWFYDYRLRSSSFHRGGIFSVQRFSSVSSQLSFLKYCLVSGYEVKEEEFGISFTCKNLKGFSGLWGNISSGIPVSVWEFSGNRTIFSFEGAVEDEFEPFGSFQTVSGITPASLDSFEIFAQEN